MAAGGLWMLMWQIKKFQCTSQSGRKNKHSKMARLIFFKSTILLLFFMFVTMKCSEDKEKQDAERKEIEGLKITTIKEAPSCAKRAKNGDKLTVHYDGYLVNGKEFDSSRKRNQPFVITLGRGMVIPGWEKGLVGTCEGEQRRLEIAPELGNNQT